MKIQLHQLFGMSLLVASSICYGGTISDAYNSGDTLTAAKMNNIKSAVNDNDSKITANTTAVNSNKSNIATNTTSINANKSSIATNTSAISANKNNIATNASTISSLDDRVTTLESSGVKQIKTLWASIGTSLSVNINAGTWYGGGCATNPYVAGPGETAIISSDVTAYFSAANQHQFIASYTVDGGAPHYYGNGMAATNAVSTVHVQGVIKLTQDSSYVFQPAIHSDFVSSGLTALQCTTLVTIIKQ